MARILKLKVQRAAVSLGIAGGLGAMCPHVSAQPAPVPSQAEWSKSVAEQPVAAPKVEGVVSDGTLREFVRISDYVVRGEVRDFDELKGSGAVRINKVLFSDGKPGRPTAGIVRFNAPPGSMKRKLPVGDKSYRQTYEESRERIFFFREVGAGNLRSWDLVRLDESSFVDLSLERELRMYLAEKSKKLANSSR